MRQRRHLRRGRRAVTHTLAESGEALGSAGASSRKGRSRATLFGAGISDERLATFGMQPLLEEEELLVSASSSVTLILGDMTSARLGKQLGTALGKGATLEAPLHGASGAQRVLIAS